ncbi:hypothetical protein [Chengkuizengella axinellae]|uniref:SnoaL-like domain-containing protein n=1 Tax=Chengkuizengella axinellae TaxID=3064388 RepID=A0ABT9J341_9BACL|nr:hypothetical protein [Chengkuizengella sp. 2205SS18-9]MDP5276037.1 hypothetical protein [Chengkuizengella sp. 2205SS18-9]
MTTNILVKQEDITQVKTVLNRFQQGYTNKNIEVLDEYINDLFINDNSMITVGTSRTEWCFGLKDLKDMIESDWTYWGDLIVDFENAKINSKDNAAWFIADCTISFDTPDNYDEWCADLIADFFEEGRFINFKTMPKLAMLNLKLASIVKSISGNQGSNIPFPLRLSGGLIKKNDKWLIHRLQFSAPMSSYPEWRIDRDNPDSLKYFNEIKEKMSKYNEKYDDNNKKDIIETLHDFQNHYLNTSTNIQETVQTLFLSHDDIYVVDPHENPAAIGWNRIEKMIWQQREKWDEMNLNIHESMIRTEGNTATIVTSGILKKIINSEELLQNEWKLVKETLQKEGKGEDKLFEAQKQIAYTLKELSFGDESLWEFRFEALVIKENEQWKFHNIQFTFPILDMFEGNYNMVPLL